MTSKQHKQCSPANPIVNQGLAGGLLLLLLFLSFSTTAKEWQVSPGNGTLQTAIDSAQPGDTLLLATGTYSGSINIHQSLTLSGNGPNNKNISDSIIDGEGSSHVITVSASDVVIKGLTIQHSGNVLEDEDSGIFITDRGDRARIEDNHLEQTRLAFT